MLSFQLPVTRERCGSLPLTSTLQQRLKYLSITPLQQARGNSTTQTSLPIPKPLDSGQIPPEEHLGEIEKRAIQQALEQTKYNKTAAAKLLGLSFRALRYRLKKLGLE